MISADATNQADELRALLRAGVRPRLGLVDVGKGSRLAFELAVRVMLTDLARFTALARGGHVVEADRWHQVGDDLDRLHRMAVAARAGRVRA